MSFAKTTNGTFFAGSYQGELFRKHGSNGSWEQTPFFQYGQAVRGVVANSKGMVFVAGDDGVFRSTDNGSTWLEADSGFGNNSVATIAVNLLDHLFVAKSGIGIYRSTNDGRSWVLFDSGLPHDFINAIIPLDSTRIVAATAVGVFKSIDNGVTWQRIGTMDAFAVSLVLDAQGAIYASSDDGLFRLIPSGNNWDFITHEVDLATLAIDSHGRLLACTGHRGLLRSSNSGQTWNAIGVPVAELSGLALSPTGDVFATVVSSGAFRYDPRTDHWIQIGLFYPATSMSISPSGAIYVGRYPASVHSLDGGTTWQWDWFTNYSVLSFGFGRNELILAGTNGEGVYRSSDHGATWRQANNGLRGMQVRSMAIAPSGDILAGTDYGVHLSTNNGDSWETISSLYTDITSVLLFPDGAVAAGTVSNGIYRSNPQRTTWVPINNGLTDLRIKKVILSQIGEMIALASSKVFVSSNKGNAWVEVSEGLPSIPFSAIVEDRSGNLILGTQGAGCYKKLKE
jgi:ligand-binding sensor domain-containing protein